MTLNMTFTNIGDDVGTVSPDCNSIRWRQSQNTWTRAGGPALTDGPLVVFDAAASRGTAIAFSATADFTVHAAACSVDSAGAAGFGGAARNAAAMPLGTPLVSMLLGRPGVKRAAVAWGALMRQAHRTTRLRGAGTRALSYWS
jgi:hypothetical protein